MTTAIQKFVTDWNNDALDGFDPEVLDPDQCLFQPSQPSYQLRPSSLGQAGFITAIEYTINSYKTVLNRPAVSTPHTYGRMTDLLNVGHITESRIIAVLHHNSYLIQHSVPCTYHSPHVGDIKGTADLLLGDTVIDVKTASSANVKRLVNDVGGLKYVTQLAVYAKALGVPDAGLLVYNKDNSELTYIDVPRSAMRQALERAEQILEACSYIDDFTTLTDKYQHVYRVFEIPEPVPQMYKKERSGRYLLPQCLYYKRWLVDLLFDTEQGYNNAGNVTTYVVRVLEPAETVQRLDAFIAMTYNV